jgi:hypothetical protein
MYLELLCQGLIICLIIQFGIYNLAYLDHFQISTVT